MSILTQGRFPRLWRLFQSLAGGTVDKRRLSLCYYTGQSRILEVGCSLGNIAHAFRRFPNVAYTGIDIDRVVIDYARQTFRGDPRFRFLCEDLRVAGLPRGQFDYILFPGVLHHVDDSLAGELLAAAAKLLSPDGVLVINDPVQPLATDSWLVRRFIQIEQGSFVRSEAALRALISALAGLEMVAAEQHLVGASPVHWPRVARFASYALRRRLAKAA
jgi:SAM-dependent methyltransferase